MPNVKLCPAVPRNHHTPSYDRCQFDRRRRRSPVSLDFSELGHITTCAQAPERRLETPAWVWDEKLLRAVILSYLEGRFFVRKTDGTDAERLKRIREAAKEQAGPKAQTLKWRAAIACALFQERFSDLPESEYRKLFLAQLRGKTSHDRAQEVAREAQSISSEVFLLEKAPEVVSSVAYLYHRLKWPSPSVGETVGLSAPAVRQILFRMNRAARRLKK